MARGQHPAVPVGLRNTQTGAASTVFHVYTTKVDDSRRYQLHYVKYQGYGKMFRSRKVRIPMKLLMCHIFSCLIMDEITKQEVSSLRGGAIIDFNRPDISSRYMFPSQ